MANRKRLTDKEFNIVTKWTAKTHFDTVMDVETNWRGNDFFMDYENEKKLSLAAGFQELAEAVAYPFAHEGLDKEESEIMMNLLEEFGVEKNLLSNIRNMNLKHIANNTIMDVTKIKALLQKRINLVGSVFKPFQFNPKGCEYIEYEDGYIPDEYHGLFSSLDKVLFELDLNKQSDKDLLLNPKLFAKQLYEIFDEIGKAVAGSNPIKTVLEASAKGYTFNLLGVTYRIPHGREIAVTGIIFEYPWSGDPELSTLDYGYIMSIIEDDDYITQNPDMIDNIIIFESIKNGIHELNNDLV